MVRFWRRNNDEKTSYFEQGADTRVDITLTTQGAETAVNVSAEAPLEMRRQCRMTTP
jgi:hypothetical protein